MNFMEEIDIKIKIDDEDKVYSPFSPEDEFSAALKDYIKSKISAAGIGNRLRMTVISSQPIDEDRFRAAVKNWTSEERTIFVQEARINKRTLAGLLVAASIFIILSMSLTKHFNVLSYTIIPVLGSVALGKAAGIFIVDIPENDAKIKLLNELEKSNTVIFKYPGSQDQKGDRAIRGTREA